MPSGRGEERTPPRGRQQGLKPLSESASPLLFLCSSPPPPAEASRSSCLSGLGGGRSFLLAFWVAAERHLPKQLESRPVAASPQQRFEKFGANGSLPSSFSILPLVLLVATRGRSFGGGGEIKQSGLCEDGWGSTSPCLFLPLLQTEGRHFLLASPGS